MTLMEGGIEGSEGSRGGNIWPWTTRKQIQGTYSNTGYTENVGVGDKLFDDIILDNPQVPRDYQLTKCTLLIGICLSR